MSAAEAANETDRATRWRVAEHAAGDRLDRHLAAQMEISRNRAQHWIRDHRVQVAGRPTDKVSALVAAGDEIVVEQPRQPPAAGVEAEEGELCLLYQDADVLILDKPAGVLVHPGAGHPNATLANFLLHRYPEIAGVGGLGRPGIVHRLDKDTTGVLAIARNDRSYQALIAAFAERRVDKTYLAIVHGQPRPDRGTVDLPIGRHPHDRKRMTVRTHGRPARTHYSLRATAAGISLLELGLETGRTHQIRVHLKTLGNPLIGDPTYGEARWRSLPKHRQARLRDFPRPALHAWKIRLPHPSDGDPFETCAAVPPDLRQLWTGFTGDPWPLNEPGEN